MLDGVRVRTLDEKGDTLGFLDLLDKGVLFFAKGVFVYQSSVTEDIRGQVLYRVLGSTTACVLQSITAMSTRSSDIEARLTVPYSSSLPVAEP